MRRHSIERFNNVCRRRARVSHAGAAVGPSGAPERRRRCFLVFFSSSPGVVRTMGPGVSHVASRVIARAGDTRRAFMLLNAKYNSPWSLVNVVTVPDFIAYLRTSKKQIFSSTKDNVSVRHAVRTENRCWIF